MNRKDIGLFMMMGDVNWKWKGEWEKIAEMRKSVCWSHMMRIKPMALFVAQSVFGAAMQATETLARWNEKPTQHPFVNKFSAENEKRSFRHHWPPPSAILDRCNDGNYCTSEKETNETRYRQKKNENERLDAIEFTFSQLDYTIFLHVLLSTLASVASVLDWCRYLFIYVLEQRQRWQKYIVSKLNSFLLRFCNP